MKPSARRCPHGIGHSSLADWYLSMGREFNDEIDSCFFCLEEIIIVHLPDNQYQIPIKVTMYYISEWP